MGTRPAQFERENMTGIVKSFNAEKGYGFLLPLIGRPDTVEPIFFHASAFKRKNGERAAPPPVGAVLRFDLCRSDKGRGVQACNIELETQGLKLALERPAPLHRFPGGRQG